MFSSENINPIFQKYNRWVLYGAIGVVLFVIITIASIALGDIPSFEELENPKYDLASVIYDVKGQPFGRYYIEDRVAVDYADISQHVINALIATEDDRFYNHSGIDVRALFRVGIKSLLLQKESSGGGSTITQQLAKLLYKRPSTKGKSLPVRMFSLVKSKIKEWVIAVKLERAYTKEEILAMYLNKFEFVNSAHGIESAADVYFNKSQKELTIPQAATLVGMLKNPSLYNPNRFPNKCMERRNTVLSLMQSHDFIDERQFETFKNKPIDMSGFSRKNQSDGPAPYFRAELTKFLRNLFASNHIKKPDGSDYNIYTDGLKIYTTIDLTYQKYAEEAVHDHMIKNQERYDKTWKNRDPWTYDATKYQKELRASILENQCKASDRYLSLRGRVMGQSLEAVDRLFPELPMSDNVIELLDSISQNLSTLKKGSKSGRIDITRQADYNRLLHSSEWPRVAVAYKKLQELYKKEFNTPIKMMVFDYEKGEKEVVMSPYDSVRYHKMILQAGMLVVDPATGYVKAWVGGVNHKYFKYDHVTMRRSVGSTIKPFVYTQAMAIANISPCQEFDDIQYTISPADSGFGLGEEWSPANAEERFSGKKFNLFQGLALSKNSISVRLLKEMGTVEPIRNLLDNLGIDKNLRLPNGQLAVPKVPSICLGAVDLTLLEMTGAYDAFANNGVYTQPVFISHIEDKTGKIIYRGTPVKKAAINALYNAAMVTMLQNNIGGSMGVKSPIGGKTGTTNDFADGWFMGITPSLVMGVWTGGDDKWIRFLSIYEGQGSAMAKPIVSLFIKKLEADPNSGYDANAKFAKPPRGYSELMDCAKFKSERKSTDMQMTEKQKAAREVFDEEF